MKQELQDKIVGWLKKQGLIARASGKSVAINRDSMCNSTFSGRGIPEETTYPNVLNAINKQFPVPHGFSFSGKTDDDLFLERILENNND